VASKKGENNGKSEELQGSNDMEKRYRVSKNRLQGNGEFSPKRGVRFNESNAQSGGFDPLEYSRRPSQKAYQRIHPISSSGSGLISGVRNTDNIGERVRLFERERSNNCTDRRNSKDDLWNTSNTSHSPLTTNHCKGLPIGNLTSQFFANLYLNELDYFVKFNLQERYYIRYMDDFLLFGNDKVHLNKRKLDIAQFLETRLKLKLHPAKSVIFPVRLGVEFLGFRIFRDYRRLKKENIKQFLKRMKRQQALFVKGLISIERIKDSLQCWNAHASYGNTYRLRKKLFERLVASGEWPVASEKLWRIK
jgi:hypothetical protein